MSTVAVSEGLREEVKQLVDKADERMLKAIYAMLEADLAAEEGDDWWEELPDEVKASIERGLKDIEEGRTMSHEEVIKKYSKWFPK